MVSASFNVGMTMLIVFGRGAGWAARSVVG